MTDLYFKVLGPDGVCCHGGLGRWQTDGTWMPPIYGNLSPCVRGYHLCRASDLIEWLGPVIWIAEGQKASFISSKYVIFQEARVVRSLDAWTPAVARLFAVECAQRVSGLITEIFPDETRPAVALQAARDFMAGKLDFVTMNKIAQEAWNASRLQEGAVRDAAIAAYGAAVWESDGLAAWAAAGAARTAVAAAALEHSLAVDKENGVHPRDAERKANQAAASALQVEREWQTARLFDLLGDIEPQS
ncbi:MAG: hypothetical protein HQL93_14215 [Magnetococcales bacterium]|nr:hypothetical protein [Magnetococcales bacterium]